jgi:hypothetical protein
LRRISRALIENVWVSDSMVDPDFPPKIKGYPAQSEFSKQATR